MRIRRLSIGAVALIAAVSCGQDVSLTQFSVQLQLGTGCEIGTTCHDYGMYCDAKMGIQIVDAESIYQASRAPDASPGSDAGPDLYVVDQQCVDVPGAPSLCSVDDVSVVFQDVPARMMQIQIALWSEGELELEGYDGCPTNVFDLKGDPLVELSQPQPAFGGWVYFDVGSKEVATVSLACSDPDQLNEMACQPVRTSVTALVRDMATNIVVDADQATKLDVSVGEPRDVANTEGESECVLDPIDTHDLDLVAVTTPYWAGEDLPPFRTHACVLVRDLFPRAVTSVACARIEDLEQDPSEPLLVWGLLLNDATLDDVLLAASMDDFPGEGLVVGRVVNAVGEGQAGVSVSPSDPLATVEYPTEDWTGTTFTETASHGYFLSRNAECGSQWTAQGPSPGSTQDGTYVGGLIVGKVTVLIITMSP